MLCVYLTEHEWLLVCVFACIPECIPVCIAECEGETATEIFLFCASSNVSQPRHAPWQTMRGTQVWFDLAHLQAVHAVRDHREHLHPEVRLRSTETHTHTSLLSTDG